MDIPQLHLHLAQHVTDYAKKVIPIDQSLLLLVKSLIEELYIILDLCFESFEELDKLSRV